MSERKTWDRPSHFICARDCRFGRTTVVGGWVVSTVGDYRPTSNGGRQEQIGDGRTYETMVFPLAKLCDDPECKCGGMPVVEQWAEKDFEGYNSKAEAMVGHRRMVQKWDPERS